MTTKSMSAPLKIKRAPAVTMVIRWLLGIPRLDVSKLRYCWCNTHERHCSPNGCDPRLGGITMPCQVVDLTGIAIIEEDKA